MSYISDLYRNIAQQESRALRLLYNAHGRYPNTQPTNRTPDINIDTLCNNPGHSGVYRHRRNNEPNCDACRTFRTLKDKNRVRKPRNAKSERVNTNPQT